MRAYSVTDVGKNRAENQDYVLCENQAVGSLPNLFLVADGMGGHKGGGFASRCCVETIWQTAAESGIPSVVGILQEAISAANSKLIEEAAGSSELTGMGTTIVAAVLEGMTLCVANVGDSRLYVHSKDGLRQITEDHSLVEAMIRSGELEREEARFHPKKNIITRALGGRPEVEVDFFEVDVSEEDRILMCSDGLSNMIDDEELEEVLEKYEDNIEEAARELVKRANDYGGKDNITVIVIEP